MTTTETHRPGERAPDQLAAPLQRRPRSVLGVRFTRFAGGAAAALTATEVALTICNGVLHLTATRAALVSWFAGAIVSYVLSRWAWNRTGKPDVLRETLPFWLTSVLVLVLLTLANKFGYQLASWLHLTGAKRVLCVDFIWLVANFGTFLGRFLIFHYLLFADRGATPPLSAGQAGAGRAEQCPPSSSSRRQQGFLLRSFLPSSTESVRNGNSHSSVTRIH